MQEIDDKMKDDGVNELFNKQRFLASIGNDPSIDVSKLSLPKDLESDMSPDTRRFLQDHSTDDETSKTDIMVKIHSQKQAIEKFSGNLLGMGMNRGDWAFVQIGYRKLDVCRMYLNNNRAYTKYGVFEIDRDNIYLVKKQIVCFFVLSDSEEKTIIPMPKKADKIRKQMIRKAIKTSTTTGNKKRWGFLETFHTPRKPQPPKDNQSENKPTDRIKIPGTTASMPNPKTGKTERPEIYKGPKIKLPKNISLSTEKSLIQYQADSPSIYKTTLNELHLSKQSVALKLSDPLKKAIPIVVIFGAVMGLAIVMSNAPPVIDKVAEYAGVQPPQIVLLTPDEAREAGLDPSRIPIADEDFKICHDDHTGKRIDCPVEESESTDVSESTEVGVGPTDVSTPIVEDTIAPTLVLPSDMEIQSDNDRGAKVSYIAQAIDETDGELQVSCDPPSGKIFPIGDTDVLCVVTDAAGNSSYGSFIVTVLPQTNEGPGFPILPP